MNEVHFVEACEAPVEVAFDYLANYRNVTRYWHGMTSYRPAGELDHGLGAIYESVMKLGPATLKSTVKNVRWEKNSVLAYESVSGMKSATTFVLSAAGESRCTLAFRVEFELPGGLAGRAMERTLEPVVGVAAKKTAQNMTREIAAYHAARLADSA